MVYCYAYNVVHKRLPDTLNSWSTSRLYSGIKFTLKLCATNDMFNILSIVRQIFILKNWPIKFLSPKHLIILFY